MEKPRRRLPLLTLPLLLLLLLCCSSASRTESKNTYIVHLAKSLMPAEFAEHRHWYADSLRSVSPSAELLYAYDTVAHGFSARLAPSEADAIAALAGVLAVIPESRYLPHTTRTPEFLGLPEGEPPASGRPSDVIVGILDTGIWPESRSFDDAGLGPVPAKWKGACEEGRDFRAAAACNRKLVGARFFSRGYEAAVGPVDQSRESQSPRDGHGHGTHTASTAAGAHAEGADLFGYAAGTARGMATRARVAVYKVCWDRGCFSSDILAAMEKAIDDGVDVLSLSLGGGATDYFQDSIAVGAFAAMERGILVSCSAGNGGPDRSSVSNMAPWITTVGAGTIDRDFPAVVALGNGKNHTGVSLYEGKPLPGTKLPLVYAGNTANATNGNFCMAGTLVPEKVAGKIVLCDRGITARAQKGVIVRDAGGAGMVLANTPANGEELVADSHLLPSAGVGEKAGKAIKAYLLSDPKPTATIVFEGTKVGVQPSPVVAAFSSRGPNPVTAGILKPDLIAPGVNILAGWTGALGPTGLEVDARRAEFNIISGTSMSCPHVSGLAALLKGAHPDWNPAAVRSALMTTAYAAYRGGGGGGGPLLDAATGGSATPFGMGAGHVDPVPALEPGLVYDATVEDYLSFLCAIKYTPLQIAAMSKRGNFTCDPGRKYAVGDLNYPSFAVVFETGGGGGAIVRHTRTLTNVGEPGTYRATVSASPGGVKKVAVEPAELSFTRRGEKRSYAVSFTAGAASKPSGSESFGRLEWSNGKHVVASPIAVTWM